jgi:spermidine synthase
MRTNLFVSIVITLILLGSFFYWRSNKDETSHHVKNEYGSVWVYDSKDRRCMSFLKPPARTNQSCMSLSSENAVLFDYVKMLLSTLFIKEDPRKILIIGLGGASLPKALNILVPNAKIHIVEINPAIPLIAEQYFGYKQNDTNKIFVADGIEYVKDSRSARYDIIFIDAFGVDYIPEGFLTNSFMSDIKRILKEDGIVAMNTSASSKQHHLESELFLKNFGQYYNLKKSNSRVMIAHANNKLPQYQEIAKKSILWVNHLSKVRVNQSALLSLYENSLQSTK